MLSYLWHDFPLNAIVKFVMNGKVRPGRRSMDKTHPETVAELTDLLDKYERAGRSAPVLS